MRLSGPFRYRLVFDPTRVISVENPDGDTKEIIIDYREERIVDV